MLERARLERGSRVELVDLEEANMKEVWVKRRSSDGKKRIGQVV
jgi:hypothetical protein